MSIKREFEARMVDDFHDKWIDACAKYEGKPKYFVIVSYCQGTLFRNFTNRVSGQVVTLVENEYPVGENDFFEKEDNNFVIFPGLFEEVVENNKPPTLYHLPTSCNKCKGSNELFSENFEQGHMSEAKTRCSECGFEDYWAYGYFESGTEMVSSCDKYHT